MSRQAKRLDPELWHPVGSPESESCHNGANRIPDTVMNDPPCTMAVVGCGANVSGPGRLSA